MASQQEDLIDFNIIESHKENIQSLPSGRSAKALAALYSPPLTSQPSPLANAHSAPRAAFEDEVESIELADDPLDVYDRYVKWTLATYPSAQSTPQSRLLPLLERATKAFLSDSHYKNDVRYLRFWLHYIGLFSDAPRETFKFMAHNGVGQELALFYEEYAAWLEGQGCWTQAEEVYGKGIEKEARPVERLVRKFAEFQSRRAASPKEVSERPDSPALPVVRQVLGQKVDPFAAAAATAQSQQDAKAEVKGKKKSAKMAIFADDSGEKESALGSSDGQTWDSIGSLHNRKKENTAEPSSWTGQTMKVGKTNAGMEKLKIFKSAPTSQPERNMKKTEQVQKPVKQGRPEKVFVNLDAIYPVVGQTKAEFCFEEVMARHRGWLEKDWAALNKSREEQGKEDKPQPPSNQKTKKKQGFQIFQDAGACEPQAEVANPPLPDMDNLSVRIVCLNDENNENAVPQQIQPKPDDIARRMRREERANRTRKIKVMDVRHEKKETQTVQLNLDSPTGPKKKRTKKSAEPTMTINTREAMDEIYGIFSQPAAQAEDQESEDEEDDSEDDDDYTSCGESTTTGKMSAPGSEYGDDTRNEIMDAYGAHDNTQGTDGHDDPETTDLDEKTNVTGWSDFTTSKHVPKEQESIDASRKAKLQIFQDDDSPLVEVEHDLATPIDEHDDDSAEPRTRYIPLPPEDYEPASGTYRNRTVMANNRLPFMTPIAEATESSIGTNRSTREKDYFTAKTPSRLAHGSVLPILEDTDENEPWSSPFQDHALAETAAKVKSLSLTSSTVEGPLISDAQVNPVDPVVREFILSHPRTRFSHTPGFYDHKTDSGRVSEIRKFAKAMASKKASSTAENKTGTTLALPPVLSFEGAAATYTLRRELGAGAFAPVYLVDSHISSDEEPSPAAMKIESPPSAWEFHMLSLAHSRLSTSRAAQSLVRASELHLFSDASYLVESYSDAGSFLDLVNIGRSVEGCSGGQGAGLDECLAMFYTVELLRTVSALHEHGILHGDVKPDNVLLRLPSASPTTTTVPDLADPYCPSGARGWAHHGLRLIDFGRAIDARAFPASTRFVADWTTHDADCVEMRDGRPWKWAVDCHGVAATAHVLLFGKYMSVVPCAGAGDTLAARGKRYKPREGLKRYWATDVWGDVFGLLLNSGAEEEGELLGKMDAVRARMEGWLASCEGGGRGEGLRAKLRRVEDAVARARR